VCDSEPAATFRIDDLDRNDLDFADQLFAHVQAADEVRRNTDLAEPFTKMYSEMRLLMTPLPSIWACFLLLKAVASSLKCWTMRARLRAFVEDLGFAFVDAATLVHEVVLSQDRQLGFARAIHNR
jgi:hypothetical protein